jgi:arginyl-tRNA synthetase
MVSIIEQIQVDFQKHLEKKLGISPALAQQCVLDLNVDEQKQAFGDLNSNAALMFAKELKKSPRDIAQSITDFKHKAIQKIEIAGPGFINFFLTIPALQELSKELFEQKDQFFKPSKLTKQNINIEFVSANPTGPLHFGHGRGGIIGDVLGNILQFVGHKVTKEFYINDAGNQIKKLGLSLKARYLQLSGVDAAIPEDGYYGEYLIKIAQECMKDYGPQLLDQPDSFFEDYAKNKLLDHIKSTLNKYGIDFDVWFSEKTLHDSGAITKALELLKRNGFIYENEGALWFASTRFGDDKDRVVRKSSGELTYVAADIAYLKNKAGRGFNHLIFILGHDHHSYAIRLDAARQALGITAPLDVILYQLVKIKEGGEQVRMSKRAGKIVDLEDIINTVGKDVARFFYLNRKADAQLEFDLNLALTKTEENPVYYIQYAYVRTKSILEKAAHESALQHIVPADLDLLGDEERLLLKKMASLKQLLEDITHHYQTHTIAYYTHELAQVFSRYYTNHRVIALENIPQSRARLALVIIVHDTLDLCLRLMELGRPDRM